MSDVLPTRFSAVQLQRIIEEAIVYMCACPAQVAQQIQSLRGLYAYQSQCVSRGITLGEVHQRIAASTAHAHAEMECCLAGILELEGWDLETLTMPEGLRRLQVRTIEEDSE